MTCLQIRSRSRTWLDLSPKAAMVCQRGPVGSSEESEDEVDESVVEDMWRLEESFKGISQKYRLINRIGEGTNTPAIPATIN